MSVRSFHVPATPGTSAWPPSLPSVPTSRATRVTSDGERVELVDHRVDGVLQLEDLALDVDRDLARQVAARDRRGDLGDVAHLRGEVGAMALTESVRSFHVPATPGTTACTPSRPSVPTSRATRVTSDANERSCSTIVLMVSLSCRISPRTSTVILLRQVAVGDGDRHVGDVAHLAGQVRRHRVDVVGEVLPRAGDARHLRLAAELAFGADFARDAGHFRGEGVQLVDHRVDGVLQLEDLALHVDGDLARQVAARDRRS